MKLENINVLNLIIIFIINPSHMSKVTTREFKCRLKIRVKRNSIGWVVFGDF